MVNDILQTISNLLNVDLIPGILSFVLPILPFIIIPLAISMVDFVTLVRSRLTRKHSIPSYFENHHDFTILVPVFGHMKFLKNTAFLSQYASQVVLCTTKKESEEFYADLDRIAKHFGFRVFKSDIHVSSNLRPNPWKLFTSTLHGVERKYMDESVRDEIIRDSFSVVGTKYCIFIDGDTIARKPLEELIGMMEIKEYDVASVRVLVSKQNTIMEKLQSVEYEIAMDARKIYPWLTSGASTVAKTEVIKDIMKHHSLFFSGGDIEIGKLAKMLNYKVGHIPFEFYTDVPATFNAWFKQRMAWFGGGFRHAIINLHQFTWKNPLFYFYTTILVYLSTPIRWYEVVRHPMALLIVILLYWILIFVFHWRRIEWFYILFPFYALIQVMILVPIGAFMYFKMAYLANNVGLIKLRHKLTV